MEVLNYLILLILVAITLGLGCTITIKDAKKVTQFKFAFLIGASSQFLFMPCMGWILSKVGKLNTAEALGCIIITSAPGGTFSNFMCYHSKGNLALSVCMTCFSTVCAIGMIPLMIWLWTDEVAGFTDSGLPGKELKMDYLYIFITLLSVLLPTLLGIFIRWSSWGNGESCCKPYPRWKIVEIVGNTVAVVFVLAAVIVGINKYKESLFNKWGNVIAGFAVQPLGLAFGFIVSWMSGLEQKERIAVAWETGLQNLGLGIALIEISFDRESYPPVNEVLSVPLHAVLAYYVELGAFYFILRSVNKRYFPELTKGGGLGGKGSVELEVRTGGKGFESVPTPDTAGNESQGQRPGTAI